MTDLSVLLKRIDTSLIYPPFISVLGGGLTALSGRGYDFYALGDGGFRSESEQQALYNKGRGKNKGKEPIVTNAKPLQSAHNYGIALDLCADKEAAKAGLQPDWSDGPYRVMAAEMVMRGLEAAYFWNTFKEGPHIQLPLYEHKINLHDPNQYPGRPCLKDIYLKGGVKAVWEELDKYHW